MGPKRRTVDALKLSKINYGRIAASHPSMQRGQVWCLECGATREVDPAHCLAHGWPRCCNRTMSIDSPASPPASSGKAEE